jgi:hypothetical protein
MKNTFLLYSDSKKTKLFALANSVAERKEITKHYIEGCWFSYETDPKKDNVFYEDTEKKLRTKFPKEAIIIEDKEVKEENHHWASINKK